MRAAKNLVWKALNRMGLGGGVQLTLESGLLDNGWFRSFYTKESVDEKGNPLPWYTYAFIKFITDRIQPEFEVFEFGCGNSTLWYAHRVKSIIAVEHDRQWFEIMEKKLPANATLIFQELEAGQYANAVLQQDKKFDLVIVDGRKRNDCVKTAVRAVTANGVIILDNSERENYRPSLLLLEQEGFKRLDFWGMAPIAPNNTCTSVFYKSENCLNL